MSRIFQNKHLNYKYAVALIIIIQALFVSIAFGVRKRGYHSDELWNYGFANSTDGMHVFSQDGINYYNCLKWVDSEVLLKYISVNKSEIFSYSSIYKNAEKDLNPPLQYMLLHLICSFFPNVWSKWFCFAINLAAFIITQIYLFKFLKEITDNLIVSMSGIILYGFSVGVLNISFFLRIYALGVAFAMMFMYHSYMVFKNRNDYKKQRHSLIMVFISCFLGSYTLHLFFSISFIITFMFSIFYLFSKNIKTLLRYGLTSACAVGLSILLFPSAISHMLDNSAKFELKKYPTNWQFKIYWSFLTKDISGFHNSALYTMTKNYVFVGIVIAAFIIIPICFLSRNEIWFKNLITKLKERAKHIWENKKNFPYIVLTLLVSINFYIFIDASHTSVPRMGLFSRRYIFLLYPLYAALFILLIYYILRVFILNKKVISTIIIIIVLAGIPQTYIFSGDFFAFRHEHTGITFDDIEKDANCIVTLNDIWILTCATNELYDTNSYYAVAMNDYKQDNYSENLDTSKPLYLILDISKFADSDKVENINDISVAGDATPEQFGFRTDKDEILEYYENLPISTKLELVGTDSLYDRKVEIYRLN